MPVNFRDRTRCPPFYELAPDVTLDLPALSSFRKLSLEELFGYGCECILLVA
jgi:hypothetical protein